jgi:hypothetical protein
MVVSQASHRFTLLFSFAGRRSWRVTVSGAPRRAEQGGPPHRAGEASTAGLLTGQDPPWRPVVLHS